MLTLILFWSTYAGIPLLLLGAVGIMRGGLRTRLIAAFILLVSGIINYARFIEPRILQTHNQTIFLEGAHSTSPSIRIALFGDTHIGVFSNAMPMSRITQRINESAVDAVFLAGDLTYHPNPDDIPELFAALNDLDAPLFAVLGNHDVGFPGQDFSDALLRTLRTAGAQIVHNRASTFEIGGKSVIVSGTSDLWQQQQDFAFSNDLPANVPIFLLTHNPDTAGVVPDDFSYDLMLAGHTHGGQIRLPFIYRRAIPTSWPFDKELHRFPTPAGDRLVYVTSGTGMVGLPMRFMIPPRVDILTIHYPE